MFHPSTPGHTVHHGAAPSFDRRTHRAPWSAMLALLLAGGLCATPGRPVAAQGAPPAALASNHPAYGDVRLGGRYIHVWNPGGSSAGGARSQGVQTAASAPCRVSPCQLSYKGGPVLTTANLYTIFWLPPGWHFERTNDGTAPSAADTRYETLINQFLGDLQSSTYYNILRQYSDAPSVNGASGEFLTSPNIQDAVTLAGSAVVTDTLPTDTPPCNGEAAGASLNDVETEVVNVIQAHNWPPAILGSGGFTETIPAGYLLYTPFGLDIGQANNGVGFCSDLAFGAYHTNTIAPIYGTPYAAMRDINGDAQGAPTPAPATGDPFVDNETPASAHELAEMVTDPVPPGSWTDAGAEGELPHLLLLPARRLHPQRHGHGHQRRRRERQCRLYRDLSPGTLTGEQGAWG